MADIKSAAQKLMTTISGFSGDLASTPDGRAWVTKALHPSDPMSVSHGMPDPSSCPNVILAYNNVFRISAPTGQVGPWGFDLTVIPNAIVQAFYRVLDTDGVTTLTMGNFLNSGLMSPGQVTPVYSSCFANFRALGIEAHRLIAYGVTAYQDGPALANQGTLAASQWEVARRKYYPMGGAGIGLGTRHAIYQTSDEANYLTSQHMPNAYFGESKDGCYLPLRLSSTCDRWVTDADLDLCPGVAPTDDLNVPQPTTTGNANPPFYSLARSYMSSSILHGDQVYRPLNAIWGGISVRNLSPQTSFAFYCRMTIEARVQPMSPLAPQQSMSPPYDPVALASYFRISRELKDAYPADYNDWGKLWDVIKSVAKVALPALSMVPGPVGLISSAVNAGVSAVDAATRKVAPRDPPPAAAVQRASDLAAAARVIRPPAKQKVKFPKQRRRN